MSNCDPVEQAGSDTILPEEAAFLSILAEHVETAKPISPELSERMNKIFKRSAQIIKSRELESA